MYAFQCLVYFEIKTMLKQKRRFETFKVVLNLAALNYCIRSNKMYTQYSFLKELSMRYILKSRQCSNNQKMRPVENVEGDEEERYQELAVQFQPLTVNLWEDKTIFNPRIKQNRKNFQDMEVQNF